MAALEQSELDQLTAQLKADYQTLQREVRAELENTDDEYRIGMLKAEPGDAGDESVASALAEFNIARIERYVHAIRDIEAAFRRVKDGEYGTCTDCGNDIGFSRLQAYPTAKRCIVCQQKHEQEYAQEGHPKL